MDRFHAGPGVACGLRRGCRFFLSRPQISNLHVEWIAPIGSCAFSPADGDRLCRGLRGADAFDDETGPAADHCRSGYMPAYSGGQSSHARPMGFCAARIRASKATPHLIHASLSGLSRGPGWSGQRCVGSWSAGYCLHPEAWRPPHGRAPPSDGGSGRRRRGMRRSDSIPPVTLHRQIENVSRRLLMRSAWRHQRALERSLATGSRAICLVTALVDAVA